MAERRAPSAIAIIRFRNLQAFQGNVPSPESPLGSLIRIRVKQRGYAHIAVDAFNRLRDKRRNRNHLDLAILTVERNRHGIGHDNLFDLRVFDALIRRAAEQAVRSARVHLLGTARDQRVGCGYKRAARVDHVIVDNAYLARDIADERRDLGLVVARTILVHDCDIAIELKLELFRSLRTPDIGGHDAKLLGIETHIAIVVNEQRHGRHVIHGNAEEALDSVLVQIDCDDTVDASRLNHRRRDEP